MDLILDQLKFDANGLIPAIAQQWDTGEVLMMAWMSRDTILKSINQKRAVYYSRSRQSQWRKGDTSGHIQTIIEIRSDCDGDTLLLLVDQIGAACHEHTRTCFTRQIAHNDQINGISMIENRDTFYPDLCKFTNKNN